MNLDSNLIIAIVTVICSVLYTVTVAKFSKVFTTREEMADLKHRLERAEDLLRQLELAVAALKGTQE